jgi:hypothetical protein
MPYAASGDKPRAGPNGEGRASTLVRTPARSNWRRAVSAADATLPSRQRRFEAQSTGIAFRLTIHGDLPALTGLLQAVA